MPGVARGISRKDFYSSPWHVSNFLLLSPLLGVYGDDLIVLKVSFGSLGVLRVLRVFKCPIRIY